MQEGNQRSPHIDIAVERDGCCSYSVSGRKGRDSVCREEAGAVSPRSSQGSKSGRDETVQSSRSWGSGSLDLSPGSVTHRTPGRKFSSFCLNVLIFKTWIITEPISSGCCED